MINYNNVGLFIIPIKVNKNINTYNDYIDLAVEAENNGYTHVYIGEHLTDKRENIQSSMIFSAAILARTRNIKVCLSVLPLPHYNIKLLVKQLEDLYSLSKGRLLIGFSQGAIAGDLDYLGIDNKERSNLFQAKYKELVVCVEKSESLSKIYPHSFFSTLLSKFPIQGSKLFDNGFSAISSNFTNKCYLENHIKCLINNINRKKIGSFNANWNIGINLLDYKLISNKSREYIVDTLEYIYNKLLVAQLDDLMLIHSDIGKEIKSDLLRQCCFSQIPEQIIRLTRDYSDYFDHFIINVFDCFDDPCYKKQILDFPRIINGK